VALGRRLDELAARHHARGNVLFYMSTPPDAFVPIVRGLQLAGLAKSQGGGWRRVIVEKPFGRDLETAPRSTASRAPPSPRATSFASITTWGKRPSRT
jgi:glucose-6-phosphate 1-dehydrogenase